MATCRVGSPGIKMPKFEFCTSGVASLPQKGFKMHRISLLNKSRRSINCCYAVSVDTKTVLKEAENSIKVKTLPLTSSLVPNSSQIESLISGMCSTSSIAEFELKVGHFELHVVRNLMDKPVPALPLTQMIAPVDTNAGKSIVKVAAASNGATTSTALVVADSSATGIQKFVDKSGDESLTILTSPTVGVFRTSFTIKGKRLPPLCSEKQMVKKGSILGCIEQMSGRMKVRSNISGEIVQLLRKDGDPVGYGDPLIAILPSFPGIKNLLPSSKA